jgi:hypothetical protein
LMQAIKTYSKGAPFYNAFIGPMPPAWSHLPARSCLPRKP